MDKKRALTVTSASYGRFVDFTSHSSGDDSTTSQVEAVPRLGRFPLNLLKCVPILLSVTASAILLKTYGHYGLFNQAFLGMHNDFKFLVYALEKSGGSLAVSLAAYSAIFQLIVTPFRMLMLPKLEQVKEKYKELQAKSGL